MRYFILSVCFLSLVLAEQSEARTVQFDDKNFAVEVPDDSQDVPVPKGDVLIYQAQKPTGEGVSVVSVDGNENIENADVTEGFLKGVTEKGGVVKSSGYQDIEGKKFFVCNFLKGSGAVVMYLINADGHGLILSYYRPNSSSAIDQDPDVVRFIHSFRFLHNPVYPEPEKSVPEKMGQMFFYVVLIFGVIYAIGNVTQKKKKVV